MTDWRSNRRSPLRIEINPWTTDEELHLVMQLRGAFIAAMGLIETIGTELIIRSSKFQEYAILRAKFPSRRADQVKYLRRLCEAPGPLAGWAPIIGQVLARYEGATELRDILAHARMQVLSGPGDNSSIKLDDYYPHDQDRIAFRMRNLTRRELERYVHRMTRTSRAVDVLYQAANQFLPPLHGDFQGTTDAS